MTVETVLEDVKQEVVAVVEETKAEVVKVDNRVKVELTDGEKFVMAQIENDFLKAQVEIQQISKRMEHLQENVIKKCQTNFVAKTAELMNKYDVDSDKWIYNAVEHSLTKK